MRSLIIGAAGLGMAALSLTTPAFAQASAEHSSAAPAAKAGSTTSEPRRTGFMLGVHSVAIPGLAIGGGADQNGEFNTTFGGGAGVTVGYGVSRLFTVFTSMELAKQKTAPTDTPEGSWGLVHLELGARANLPLGASTTPYVTASYGARALAAKATSEEGETFDASISGKYLSAGAGIERAISRSMSLDGGVDVGLGKFSHFKTGSDEWDASVNSTRVIRMRLGITWRPGARRIT
jgi:hypothetical protein